MASHHHYVPAFYLNRFTDAKDRLRVYDRRERRTFTSTPAAVAKERDFYLISEEARQIAGGAQVERDFFEAALAQEEAGTAEALRRAVSVGKVDPADRLTLAAHIAMQLVRTRRARNDFDDIATWAFTLAAQVGIHRRLHEQSNDLGDLRETAEETLLALRDGSMAYGTNQDGLMQAMAQSYLDVLPYLLDGWEWVLASTSGARFITTDSPIAMFGEYDPVYPLVGVGVASALEIWFPLDPRHALVLSRDRSLPPALVGLPSGHVRMLNRRLAFESERWIFHHPQARPLAGFQIPRKGPRWQEESVGERKMPDGTTRELVRVGAKRLSLPNERLLSGRTLRSFPDRPGPEAIEAAWAARDVEATTR